MQTLTAGSFLNLENAENIEALKFTAKRLAEHTAAVVAENLQPAALENLANDLWRKAEYVARETERRRLHEIFVENFGERFRELKPEAASAETASLEVQTNISATENDDSTEQQSFVTVESVSMPDAPKENITEAEEKKDEFLGFVKSDEPFAGSPATETDVAAATAMQGAPEKIERETIQSAREGEPVAGEKVSAENPGEIEPQSLAASAAAAKNNPPPANAVKTSAPASKSADAKEPFEFDKCTVNLSLVLLPSSSGKQSRNAIVSATSHNLPPEIEFLEINEGENLNEIADLVRDKLARFKNTLPAKYIEQLRASKTKSAKKTAPAKTQTAVSVPTRAESIQPNVEKTNGSQTEQSSSGSETEKSRAEIITTKENVSVQPATTAAAVVPQSVAATTNNVQPSLF